MILLAAPVLLLSLAATVASPEMADRLFPRVVRDEAAVALVDIDGESVGAISLIERRGYHGFLLVTVGENAKSPEHATMDFDNGRAIRFRCLTIVSAEAQIATCATKSPIFRDRLSAAEHVTLRLGDSGARKKEPTIEIVFSGSEFAHLKASGPSL